DAVVGRRSQRADERAALDAAALEREDRPHEERLASDRTERVPAARHEDRLADRSGIHHRPSRGRTARSARRTAWGKSISVHGIPSMRSKPTWTRARSSG